MVKGDASVSSALALLHKATRRNTCNFWYHPLMNSTILLPILNYSVYHCLLGHQCIIFSQLCFLHIKSIYAQTFYVTTCDYESSPVLGPLLAKRPYSAVLKIPQK